VAASVAERILNKEGSCYAIRKHWAAALLIAAPLGLVVTPAGADSNDPAGQTQRPFNGGDDGRERGNLDAYQHGHDEEMQRQHAERATPRWDDDQDRGADDYYRSPNYGYRNADQ
jgi:hypothetical protein